MTTSVAAHARRTRCQVRTGRHRENGAVPRSAPARHLRGSRHRDRPESCRGRTPSPSPDVSQVPKHMDTPEHLQLPDYLGSVHHQSRPAEPAKLRRRIGAGPPAKLQRAMRRREPETCVRQRLPTTTAPSAVEIESGRGVGRRKHPLGVHLRTSRAPPMDATDGRDSPTSLDHYRIPIPELGNSTVDETHQARSAP